jgi:hypothetical protein
MGGHSPLRGWPDARDCACVHVVNLSITLSKNLAISVPSSDWFSTQCFLAIASAGPSTAIISLCYPYPFVIGVGVNAPGERHPHIQAPGSVFRDLRRGHADDRESDSGT